MLDEEYSHERCSHLLIRWDEGGMIIYIFNQLMKVKKTFNKINV